MTIHYRIACYHKNNPFYIATSATAEIVFNETTREICFISSLQVQECGLSQLTQYNVSITDITENLIFKNNSVTESHCVTVDAPQCGPFHVSAHPYTVNNSVVYRFISQEINTGLFVYLYACIQ